MTSRRPHHLINDDCTCQTCGISDTCYVYRQSKELFEGAGFLAAGSSEYANREKGFTHGQEDIYIAIAGSCSERVPLRPTTMSELTTNGPEVRQDDNVLFSLVRDFDCKIKGTGTKINIMRIVLRFITRATALDNAKRIGSQVVLQYGYRSLTEMKDLYLYYNIAYLDHITTKEDAELFLTCHNPIVADLQHLE